MANFSTIVLNIFTVMLCNRDFILGDGASWLSERYPASALFLVFTITNRASCGQNSELLVKFLPS